MMPPSSKLSQTRKRKLESDAAAEVHGENGAGPREPEGRLANTPKRSRRSSRIVVVVNGKENGVGNNNNNNNDNGRRELHRDSQDGANGSSNGIAAAPSIERAAAAGSSAAIAALSARARCGRRPVVVVADGAPAGARRRSATATNAPENALLPVPTPPLVSQNNLRRLAQHNVRNGNGEHRLECGDRACEGNGNAAANNDNDSETDATKNDAADCNQPISCNEPSHSAEEAVEDDFNHHDSAASFHREKRKLQCLSFVAVVYPIMLLFAFAAILHAQHFDRNLLLLRRDATDASSALRRSRNLEREAEKRETTRKAMQALRERLSHSQAQILRLKREMQVAANSHGMRIMEYETIFREHDDELGEAVERIKLLRGDREEEPSSAIDLAWLRMDELMEENNELSNDLKKARKDGLNKDGNVARVQLRDKELIKMVESLSRQLQLVTSEKDELAKDRVDLLDRSETMAAAYDLLQHDHMEIADAFLAPTLIHVQNLQRTTEQQHSIILELTSLVHSLHSSLDTSRTNLEVQTIESVHAIDAVADYTNQFSLATTEHYEMERDQYMERMETKLERLEDEAMGAVQAVAAAAGKMEYERKIEEEGRWRSYVTEAESILGEIRNNLQDDDDDGESSTDKIGNLEVDGIGERSVLRAAISRRIEEGITSLRGYIHPYNYLKEKEAGSVQPMYEV